MITFTARWTKKICKTTCEYVFEKLDLDLNDALEISEKFMRPITVFKRNSSELEIN